MLRSILLPVAVVLPLATFASAAHAQADSAQVAAAEALLASEATSAARQLVATRWNVTPDRIAIEWSPVPRGTEVPDQPEVELLGSGLDGWWVAAIRAPGTDARVRMRAGVWTPVGVAARPISRGSELTSEDIVLSEAVAWGPPAPRAIAQPGWTLRRAVETGDPLVTPTVEPPVMVRSGDQVELSFQRGAIALSVEGVALGTAREGERIRVRASTGRLVQGIAVGPGRVRAGALRRPRTSIQPGHVRRP